MAIWINVKDKLPEKDGKYLCYIPVRHNGKIVHKILNIYHFLNKAEEDPDLRRTGHKGPVWAFYDTEWGACTAPHVTHWTELPEAPEEDEDDVC